jgi:D-alanyl-D-alanine carboxypeptidase
MISSAKSLVSACVVGLAMAGICLGAAQAGPVILFEATSGRVLYADEQDHHWYPASLTKMMTAYLTFDAIKSGRLKLTDTVVVSEKALEQAPSKLGLPIGTEIGVDIALRALVVKSANDVAIMLAEKIGGTEEGFVQLMNDTARRLGMNRTHFVNPHGLPVPGQISTARDLARLARAALQDFPEHDAVWGLSEMQLGEQRLRSHNALLRSFEGADGIKTGFICDSGFNVAASATRDGKRLIAVVLGEPSGDDRNLRAASLLNHGFETAAWKVRFGVPTIETMPIDPAAEGVRSVRRSVVSWNCNGKKPARQVAKRKPRGPKAKTAPQTRAAGAPQQSAKGKPKAATSAAKAPATTKQ